MSADIFDGDDNRSVTGFQGEWDRDANRPPTMHRTGSKQRSAWAEMPVVQRWRSLDANIYFY